MTCAPHSIKHITIGAMVKRYLSLYYQDHKCMRDPLYEVERVKTLGDDLYLY